MPSPLDEPESTTPAQIPDDETHNTQPPLTIEAPAENGSGQPGNKGAGEIVAEEVHTLDVGEGNVVKLDKLGPMIINSDGTLSRIQNWQDLHPIEQERTVRLLVKKRNLVRLQKLDTDDKAGATNSEERLTALKGGGEGAG